jgi:hypothetical protein
VLGTLRSLELEDRTGVLETVLFDDLGVLEVAVVVDRPILAGTSPW